MTTLIINPPGDNSVGPQTVAPSPPPFNSLEEDKKWGGGLCSHGRNLPTCAPFGTGQQFAPSIMPVVMATHHIHMSKADLRKSNKPIMEKRRRARINQCLDELKSLILEAMKKDPARHAKLEKADILEMTVQHLQDMQRNQMRSAVAADPSVLTKFHSGFNECANEVTRYVSSIDGVDDGVKRRLLGHLTGCMTGLNQVLPLAVGTPPANATGDVNNNTGRLHFLSVSPRQEHRSAFTAVHHHQNSSRQSTPPVSPVLSDSSSSDSCQELRVHIAEPPRQPAAELPLTPNGSMDGLLMEAPRPSTSSVTAPDMWRPW